MKALHIINDRSWRHITVAIVCGGFLAIVIARAHGPATVTVLVLSIMGLLAPAVRLSLFADVSHAKIRVPIPEMVLLVSAFSVGISGAAPVALFVGAGTLICGPASVSFGQAAIILVKPVIATLFAAAVFAGLSGGMPAVTLRALPAVAASVIVLVIVLRIFGSRQDVEPTEETEPMDVVIPPSASAEDTRPAVEEVSLIDTLTRTANQKYLMMFLAQEMSRSLRSGLPLSILLVDVNELDKVNTQSGRESGDKTLQDLAVQLRLSVREYDVVARYAGDEFVVVLPETDAPEALEIAERVHQSIKINENLLTGVTIGIATYPAHGTTADDLVSSAHHALNRAKFSGVNLCSCHLLARAG